jgi:acyl-CoA synthetase (AMP-forming)/AMP-acid ligase II
VFGVPDAHWVETIKAAVVLQDGARLSLDELVDWCASVLPSYMKPTSLDFVDEIPIDAAGKPVRRQLRAPYWAGHAE